MNSVIDSLMLGGYENDIDLDIGSDFDLWVEEIGALASEMTIEQLYGAALFAELDNNKALSDIYNGEIEKRCQIIKINGHIEEFCDDPDEEDRRKEHLENYIEAEDELPF